MTGYLTTPPRWTWLLASGVAALILGTLIRLPRVAGAGFPLYDGGMTYAMTQEIAANGLKLPLTTAYNGGEIPFAYPPFGHYSAIAFRWLAGVSMLTVFQWLPLLVNLVTVALFPVLAARLLETRRAVLIASLAFPCFPFSYQWLIMGAGVTRSWGMLFFILAATGSLLTLDDPKPLRVALAAFGVAGAVLSHPEFGVLSILTVALAALAMSQPPGAARLARRKRWALAAGILAAAAALTAPWWVTMLTRYGLTPYRAAAGSSSSSLSGFLTGLAIFPLTAEPVLSVLGVLGIVGALVLAGSGRPFAGTWVLLAMVAVPRNSATPITAPLAVAVGSAWIESS